MFALVGLGLKQRNVGHAMKHFETAAQAGHLLGMYDLAEMHGTGTGVYRACHIATEVSFHSMLLTLIFFLFAFLSFRCEFLSFCYSLHSHVNLYSLLFFYLHFFFRRIPSFNISSFSFYNPYPYHIFISIRCTKT